MTTEPCADCGFSYDADDDPAAAITAGADGIAALLVAIPADVVRTRPSPDVWSPVEYACHVRDVLLVQRERVLAARRTDGYVCQPMGRDERADHDGYRDQRPTDIARQVRDAALLFVTVLSRLEPDDWHRTMTYNYPAPAVRTVTWVARHTVHEVRHHLRDLTYPSRNSG